jgi:hypothetical protein
VADGEVVRLVPAPEQARADAQEELLQLLHTLVERAEQGRITGLVAIVLNDAERAFNFACTPMDVIRTIGYLEMLKHKLLQARDEDAET